MSWRAWDDDHLLAATVAEQTGRALVSLRREFMDPALRRDRGDQVAHDLIMALLATARPDDAVLSEEAADDPGRLASARVWIVDPLDGTREFGELRRTDWAVHVALWEHGELAAGAVALPARGMVLGTGSPPVAPPPHSGPIRLVVSRTRPPSITAALRESLGAQLVPMGSAGAKAMAVVLGDADVYTHAGGQYEWDSAAPAAVALAAGLHVSRLDGSPLRYNRPEPFLPDVLICRPELAERVLGAVRGLIASVG